MKKAIITALILCANMALAQSGTPCAEKVELQMISLDDLVRDTGFVRDALKPGAAKQIRRRDQEGFVFGEVKGLNSQILQLMDGFDGEVKIFVDDAIAFEGKAVTDHSTGQANVHVNLGVRDAGRTKRLRIQYGEHCMTAQLDGNYPVVLVYRLNSWIVNMMDFWPVLE